MKRPRLLGVDYARLGRECLRNYEICNKALIGNWKNQVKAENGAGEGGGAGESGRAEVVRVQ
jgi:hypothetical protein